MHRHVRVLPGTALGCVLWLFAMAAALPSAAQTGVPAAGEDASGPVIAVIDMQRILRESLAVSQMQRKIEELRQAYQAEFRERDRELRQNDQELARQRSNLSADDFAQKRQEMERKVAEVQRGVQQRRRSLDRIFGQGMSKVREALIAIVNEVAAERNIDVVLAKSTVVAVKQELDITAEVLARLDSSLPRIDFLAPQN